MLIDYFWIFLINFFYYIPVVVMVVGILVVVIVVDLGGVVLIEVVIVVGISEEGIVSVTAFLILFSVVVSSVAEVGLQWYAVVYKRESTKPCLCSKLSLFMTS